MKIKKNIVTKKEATWILATLSRVFFFHEEVRDVVRFLSIKMGKKIE